MSQRLLQLTASLKPRGDITAGAGEDVIEVSAPASTAAKVYEKLRTTIDYQEEHLLRRNAILRIINRYLGSDIPLDKMSENLLKELVWAGYLPNHSVPVKFAHDLRPIFDKYDSLFRAAEELHGKKEEAHQWILDVMSSELEYAISPPVGDEALASYMYEEMKSRMTWEESINLKADQKDLLLYIAIHKTLLKSNRATLRFRVLTLYYPDWPGASSNERVQEISSNLNNIIRTIEKQITHPVVLKLEVLLSRRAGLFRTLRDVILYKPEEFPALLNDPREMDLAVRRELKKRTSKFRVRLRRTVIRAVLFLFITKMFLALILEIPYDLIFVGQVAVIPLGINIIFHPLFLAFLSLTVQIPERKNTDDYRDAIRALIVGADHDIVNLHMKRDHFGTWSKIFYFIYSIVFLFVYGVIGVLLSNFGFNIFSIALFLFFMSLVTFFGVRIRGSTKDIVVSGSRSSLIGSLFDVFMLPVVRAGRWMSVKVAKINVFIYFFDFIIEAPFKVAVNFVEGWLAFVREKKEEI
ncbi:MAG: hypothetical protein Q8P30_03020 [Candidatus Uhrbacteria bacterium]|nr:hypothetical protein [Candidatus Uhrbacteria bacterium]